MEFWQTPLRYDSIQALLSSENPAIQYFVRRDLLSENVEEISHLWHLPSLEKTLRKQQPDGSWRYPGKQEATAQNFTLIETWRQFRVLVDQFGGNRNHPQTAKAAEYLLSCQTENGDIRGFIANQYATYYTGALLSLLIKAGYEDDTRITKGIRWLLAMRQNDGGWSIPIITHQYDWKTICTLTSTPSDPIEPDPSKPFCHNATGMIIRAFAAHLGYKNSEAAKTATQLLKSRFFKPNAYTSYRSASHWVRFQYPFWWNNLVAALDLVSLIDPTLDDAMQKAINWLVENQQEDGLWQENYTKRKIKNKPQDNDTLRWITLAICRIFKRVIS